MAKVSKSVAGHALKTYKRELANDGEELACMRAAIEEVLNEVNRGRGYHRPVCAACQVDMRPECNGVGVLDMADFGPCDLWDADLWECPKCGQQIVSGFGSNPISRHYEGDRFTNLVKSYEENSIVIESK